MIYTQSNNKFPKDRFDEIETHYIETYGGMEYGVMGRIPREVHLITSQLGTQVRFPLRRLVSSRIHAASQEYALWVTRQ